MKKKILWLTTPDFSYVLEEAESTIVDIRQIYKKNSFYNNKLFIFIRIVFCYLKIDRCLFGSWKNELNKYDVILFRDGTPNFVVNSIRKMATNQKIVIFFGNIIIDPLQKQYLSFSRKVADLILTFNKADAEKFFLNYVQMPYTGKNLKHNNQGGSGVFFLGRDKGRKAQIIQIKKTLEENCIPTNFTIVENKAQFKPYHQLVKETLESKAILEIIEERQEVNSLRILESIFLQKKIVTSDISMKNKDFYIADNVFIFGVDNLLDIKLWYEKPYQPLPKEIQDKYSLDEFGRTVLKYIN